MQTRRTFVQWMTMAIGAVALTGGTMFLTACGNVAQSIIIAFQGILRVLAQAGVITNNPLVVAVTSALDAVLGAITAYQNAPAADKATFGLQLATAIQLAQARLQTFWSTLNVSGTTAIVVEGLLTILLSTLASFLPQLPVPPAVVELQEAKRLPRQIIYGPVTRSDKQFRKDCNAICTQHGLAPIF
jgi:hypothetical protein